MNFAIYDSYIFGRRSFKTSSSVTSVAVDFVVKNTEPFSTRSYWLGSGRSLGGIFWTGLNFLVHRISGSDRTNKAFGPDRSVLLGHFGLILKMRKCLYINEKNN